MLGSMTQVVKQLTRCGSTDNAKRERWRGLSGHWSARDDSGVHPSHDRSLSLRCFIALSQTLDPDIHFVRRSQIHDQYMVL